MELTNREREIATSIVEALVEYGLNEHLAQYGEHSAKDWFDACGLYGMGFSASGGVTKLCIFHDDLDDWIIKVGYTENLRCDYAQLEYENYLAAVEAGFGYYFPKTVFIGEFGGRPFFVQELCDCDESQVSSDWYNRLRDQYEEDEEEYDPDLLWGEVSDLEDEERVMLSFCDQALLVFLRDHHINDLHEGNFGYIGDRMVIVDFSGY